MLGARILALAAAAMVLMLAACGGGDDSDSDNGGDAPADLGLTSEDFGDGSEIPEDFSCEGRDHSPRLRWGSRPDGTESLAIIMDDLDADFIHWVAYDMDPALGGIDFIGQTETFPGGGTDNGTNSFGEFGYGGPCPPEGQTHTYRFRIFALDTMLGLEPGETAETVEAAMEGHILAQGELTGTYGR